MERAAEWDQHRLILILTLSIHVTFPAFVGDVVVEVDALVMAPCHGVCLSLVTGF